MRGHMIITRGRDTSERGDQPCVQCADVPSLVLTKGAFLHRDWLEAYWADDLAEVRDYVTKGEPCYHSPLRPRTQLRRHPHVLPRRYHYQPSSSPLSRSRSRRQRQARKSRDLHVGQPQEREEQVCTEVQGALWRQRLEGHDDADEATSHGGESAIERGHHFIILHHRSTHRHDHRKIKGFRGTHPCHILEYN